MANEPTAAGPVTPTSRRDIFSIVAITVAVVALAFSAGAFVLASNASTDADEAVHTVENMPLGVVASDAHADDAHATTDTTMEMHDEAAADEHQTFAFGEAAAPEEATRTIGLDAVDIAFEPTEIVIDHEDVILFRIHNTGKVVHDFTIGDAATQAGHAEEMAQFTLKQLSKGKGHDHADANAVLVQPGETKELALRFTAHGELIFGCHVPGHYEAGMRGTLMVN